MPFSRTAHARTRGYSRLAGGLQAPAEARKASKSARNGPRRDATQPFCGNWAAKPLAAMAATRRRASGAMPSRAAAESPARVTTT